MVQNDNFQGLRDGIDQSRHEHDSDFDQDQKIMSKKKKRNRYKPQIENQIPKGKKSKGKVSFVDNPEEAADNA